MKYLVVSEDALKGSIRTSQHFPLIVNVQYRCSAEDVISEAFDSLGLQFGARDGKVYVVVPMHEAKRVTYRKTRMYDVTVQDYE